MIGIVTNTIYVWPDGSWMHAHEHIDYLDAWKGDDYAVREVPVDATDDELDTLAFNIAHGGA